MKHGITHIATADDRSTLAGESLGCKVAKRNTRQAQSLTPALKAKILDSLAKVDPKSFAGYCIRVFVGEAHLKKDAAIIRCIKNLQQQITDNPKQMQNVLGGQFEFIRTVTF